MPTGKRSWRIHKEVGFKRGQVQNTDFVLAAANGSENYNPATVIQTATLREGTDPAPPEEGQLAIPWWPWEAAQVNQAHQAWQGSSEQHFVFN